MISESPAAMLKSVFSTSIYTRKEENIHLPTDTPSLPNLTHMATIDTAEAQMLYQVASTAGPVNDTSIEQAALAVGQFSRRGMIRRGNHELY